MLRAVVPAAVADNLDSWMDVAREVAGAPSGLSALAQVVC
jgi:hypothetical protein